jgi:hypothetical protein
MSLLVSPYSWMPTRVLLKQAYNFPRPKTITIGSMTFHNQYTSGRPIKYRNVIFIVIIYLFIGTFLSIFEFITTKEAWKFSPTLGKIPIFIVKKIFTHTFKWKWHLLIMSLVMLLFICAIYKTIYSTLYQTQVFKKVKWVFNVICQWGHSYLMPYNLDPNLIFSLLSCIKSLFLLKTHFVGELLSSFP